MEVEASAATLQPGSWSPSRSPGTVRSARSHRSGRSSGESVLHGVVASDSETASQAQVQLVISQIDDFDDIASEPSLHMPGRGPARPATLKTETDPSPPEDLDSEKAISIRTQKPPKAARHRCCRSCLWAKCWQQPRWRQCGMVAAAVVWILVIASVLCLGLFWPRDPTWRLTRLQMDVDALMSLVTAASGSADGAAVPDQSFRAEVEVRNPNLLGGEAEPGTMSFIFGGRQVGAGITKASTVPPQSTSTVVAEGSLTVDQELLEAIALELRANNPTLTFEVLAESDIQSIFRMHYRMHCKIDFSIPDLMMAETRARAVTSRECEYTF